MTRLSLFNSPLLLGFDQFERVLDRAAKSSAEGYPPCNIEQLPKGSLRITLAVAGFAKEDLSVVVEDNQLFIRGRHSEEDEKRVYLHRGIANRQFQKSFVLADGIEVKGAFFSNGLLNIDLVRPQTQRSVQNIKIQSHDEEALECQKIVDANEEASKV